MVNKNSIVIVYNTQSDAEQGLRALPRANFDMKRLSMIARHCPAEDQVAAYYQLGERMKCFGEKGAFWGGLWSVLPGAGYFVIPGIGATVAAGPLVMWMVSVLEGDITVNALTFFGAALYAAGIPKESIYRYEADLKLQKFLLLFHGRVDEVMRTRNVLRVTYPEETNIHFADQIVRTAG